MTLRSRLRAPALLAVSTVAAGLSFTAVPAANAAVDPSCTSSPIEAYDTAGNDLGHLVANGQGGEYTLSTGTGDAATFTIPSGSQQELLDSTGQYAGLSVGGQGSTLAPGSAGYTLLYDFSAPTTPDQTGYSQTAVWSYDPSTGELSSNWVNPDSSTPSDVAWLSNYGYMGTTGDLGALRNAGYSDQFTQISFFACGGTPTNPPVLQDQTVSFDSTAPDTAYPGQTYDVSATSTSGNDVTYSSLTTDICTVAASTVTFLHAGLCTVAADSAAGNGYNAAPQATQDVTVSQAPTTTSLNAPETYYGQDNTMTATVTVPDGTTMPTGTVQFSENGSPVGDPVNLASDGTAASPNLGGDAGSYPVSATFTPDNGTDYSGSSDSQTLVVDQVPTTTSLSAPEKYYSQNNAMTATVTVPGGTTLPTGSVQFYENGNPIGDPVALGTDGTATSQNLGGDSGSYPVSATFTPDNATDYSGSSDYQTLYVDQVTPQVNVTAPDSLVTGQTGTATATISVPDGVTIPTGTVQFYDENGPLGDPVAVSSDGTATSPSFSENAGSSYVEAYFTSDDQTNYSNYWWSNWGYAPFWVGQADTTSHIATDGQYITDTVTPVAPGAGSPTGNVTFYLDGNEIGTADVHNGVATLAHITDTSANHGLSAVYDGDNNFVGSADSTTRNNPSIVATVTSRKPANDLGWYRTPVTISYACTTNGAPLTTDCPAPVTVSTDGGNQTIEQTIMGTDGGVATVVNRVSFDRTAPVVHLHGVKPGVFKRPQQPNATAIDKTSGVRHLYVFTLVRAHHKRIAVAKAVDNAGNVTVTRVTYFVKK